MATGSYLTPIYSRSQKETVDRACQFFLGVSSSFKANFHHSLHTGYLGEKKEMKRVHSFSAVTKDVLVLVWMEMEYRLDISRITKGAHIESLKGTTLDSSSYEQLSEFERGRIIGMKEAGSANRRIARHIGRRMRPSEDTGKNGWTMADFSVMMVEVDLGPRQIWKSDRLSDQLSQRLIHHNQPSELCPENPRRRVWRHLGQRAYSVFTIARDTSPQPGVVVWGAISFDSRTPLGDIRGTLTAQRYVDDILRTVLLPSLLQYPGRIFSEIMPDRIRHVYIKSLVNEMLVNSVEGKARTSAAAERICDIPEIFQSVKNSMQRSLQVYQMTSGRNLDQLL
ncbi:uncharacterized protein TNCV_529131 [Trichonephila clavipes]|nr:uncharacterized protein TNCV_529131 [Trichonephila clavipes]